MLINTSSLRALSQAAYNSIANQFTDVWFDALPGEAIETFLRRLNRAGKVLDAGCGPGHHTSYMKNMGFDPVGIDYSREMLRIATAKNKNIPFVYGDIVEDILPKAEFDGVWSAVALNHVPREELPQALGNLVSTIKPGSLIGLNFQIDRPSEIVSREKDCRFFDYPTDEKIIVSLLEELGVDVVATHFGTTDRNMHGLPLEMRFATIVARKLEIVLPGSNDR